MAPKKTSAKNPARKKSAKKDPTLKKKRVGKITERIEVSPLTVTKTPEQVKAGQAKEGLRSLVQGFYDLQKLRIQTGNRLSAAFRAKLGQAPGTRQEDLDKEDVGILDEVKKEFKHFAEGVAALADRPGEKPKGRNGRALKFESGSFDTMIQKLRERTDLQTSVPSLISTSAEFALVDQYMTLLREEDRAAKEVAIEVDRFPVWHEFFSKVRGIGPSTAGVLIGWLDIHRARYVSSLWKYCGLDVAPDGRGRGRFKEHLVESSYLDSNGDEQKKMGITYNPWLRTKLLGVIVPNLIRATGDYYQVYKGYKNRLENHPVHKEKTKMHRERMARRYVAKILLQNLYPVWKQIEGLEVMPPYAEAKLGIRHGGDISA